MTKTALRITYQDFLLRCKHAVGLTEEYTYYIFRADTNTVLLRGVKGYEAAKQHANELRKKLGLQWDQIKFKSERRYGISDYGMRMTNAYGEKGRIDYARTVNPSKGRRFRGYYDKQGNFHDLD